MFEQAKHRLRALTNKLVAEIGENITPSVSEVRPMTIEAPEAPIGREPTVYERYTDGVEVLKLNYMDELILDSVANYYCVPEWVTAGQINRVINRKLIKLVKDERCDFSMTSLGKRMLIDVRNNPR